MPGMDPQTSRLPLLGMQNTYYITKYLSNSEVQYPLGPSVGKIQGPLIRALVLLRRYFLEVPGALERRIEHGHPKTTRLEGHGEDIPNPMAQTIQRPIVCEHQPALWMTLEQVLTSHDRSNNQWHIERSLRRVLCVWLDTSGRLVQVLDASFINCKILRRFFEEQIADAKAPETSRRVGSRGRGRVGSRGEAADTATGQLGSPRRRVEREKRGRRRFHAKGGRKGKNLLTS